MPLSTNCLSANYTQCEYSGGMMLCAYLVHENHIVFLVPTKFICIQGEVLVNAEGPVFKEDSQL
jgi:hypothetical protein